MDVEDRNAELWDRGGARHRNRRDAFSHSPQCDEWFSKFSDIPGGEPHVNCCCWCHLVGVEDVTVVWDNNLELWRDERGNDGETVD